MIKATTPLPWLIPLTHWSWDKMAATFADDIFKCIFVNEKFCILIEIPLEVVPKVAINNN